MEYLVMNPSFWQGRRVFITGHTGFKGSWLSLLLQSFGADVTGFALAPPTKPSLFLDAQVANGMRSVEGDIRDGGALLRAMQEARPEIVLHLAAQALVRYSYEAPYETYSTNVMGLVNLFEAVRQTAGIRAVVNVTSDKCYENREWPWGYRENEAMGGHDPYSSSKGCAELVTSAYRRSFFNPETYPTHGIALASARAGNVIGGGDWATDRLVPDILRGLLDKNEILVRHPDAIRPWQHVLEPIAGYVTLAERLTTDGPAFADAWNFGPADEDSKPVKWIVKNLVNAWGRSASWRTSEKTGPHEAHFLKLDSSKARGQLGWKPRLTLTQALTAVVEWAQAHEAGSDMREVTLLQIKQYISRG